MVNLDDGWISIIEELIAMELEMRSAPIDLSDRMLQRVRKALLVARRQQPRRAVCRDARGRGGT